jgi:hypothetical protein
VDDPHLFTELRALRAEAERLRQVLREADLHPVERSRVPVPEAVRFRVADHRRKRSLLRGGSSVNP